MNPSKKIVFFSLPAYGHLNPTLGIIKTLVKQGHEVVAYNTEEFREMIEDTGAKWKYLDVPSHEELVHATLKISVASRLCLTVSEKVIPQLIQEIKAYSPDVILHDSLCLWGKITALHLSIPAVSLFTTLIFNKRLIFSNLPLVAPEIIEFISSPRRLKNLLQDYRALYRKYQLKSPSLFDLTLNKEPLNLVFTSLLFQPNGNKLASHYTFIGPVIEHRDEEKIPVKTERKIIYISLGTIHNEYLEFYKMCIDAFTNSPYDVYMSVGPSIDMNSFSNVPENIHISPFQPQIELLKQGSLCITHAGMNTISESMYFGVPMILFPLLPEQRINAKRIQDLGMGIYLKNKKIQAKKLRIVAEGIINYEKYNKKAEKIKESLRAGPGADGAAEEIIKYINKTNVLPTLYDSHLQH